MARFLIGVGFAVLLAACSGDTTTTSGGDGGTGGDAVGAGGQGGTAGAGGVGGESGRGGSVGDGGSSGAGGVAGSGGGGGFGGGDPKSCPVISEFVASPSVVPSGATQSTISFDVVDPEMSPEPLQTRLSATTGTFDDPTARSTSYTCGAPGTAEITVKVTDGDPDCDAEQTIPIQCPSDIPVNICPNLFTVNAIPSDIPPGQDSTEVQTRAEDPDGGPLPLVTTFYAFRGTFDDPNAKDTVYHCESSGLQEICVDASDGACVKTLCTDVRCP